MAAPGVVPDADPAGWNAVPTAGERWGYEWLPAWHHDVSVLDVDGVRFVIDAGYPADATPRLRAEVARVVSSVEFVQDQ
jgi:hypothetical protein